jgi:hypothetical protein
MPSSPVPRYISQRVGIMYAWSGNAKFRLNGLCQRQACLKSSTVLSKFGRLRVQPVSQSPTWVSPSRRSLPQCALHPLLLPLSTLSCSLLGAMQRASLVIHLAMGFFMR